MVESCKVFLYMCVKEITKYRRGVIENFKCIKSLDIEKKRRKKESPQHMVYEIERHTNTPGRVYKKVRD